MTANSSIDGFMAALKFISNSMNNYSFSEEIFSETSSDKSEFIFFSREYLRQKKWAVIPLWEGDLRVLLLENDVSIKLMDLVIEHCLSRGCNQLNYSTIDRIEKWWYPDVPAFAITNKEINLFQEDPNEFFWIRSPDNLPPYRGNNLFWPIIESFVLYTDGDNLAFMVGDKTEIENILGVTYEYCLERFLGVNVAYKTNPKLLRAFVNFCREHI